MNETTGVEMWTSAASRRDEFDQGAVAYDRYRPRYPDSVFDEIVTKARLGPGASAVEIGAGTGIATVRLVERGLRVTAVEPAPAMAAIVRAKLGDQVELVERRFEEWDGAGPVDLVVAFNAWHWVDPGRGVDAVARMVRTGGWLALVWTEVVSWGQAPFEDRMAEVTGAVWPKLGVDEVFGPSLDPVRNDVRFISSEVSRHRFTRRLAAADYVSATRTYGSNHDEAALARIERIITDELGGFAVKVEEAVLHLFHRH